MNIEPDRRTTFRFFSPPFYLLAPFATRRRKITFGRNFNKLNFSKKEYVDDLFEEFPREFLRIVGLEELILALIGARRFFRVHASSRTNNRERNARDVCSMRVPGREGRKTGDDCTRWPQ